MPKVRINGNVYVDGRLHREGSFVDLDDEKARELIKKGSGSLVVGGARNATDPAAGSARKAVKPGE